MPEKYDNTNRMVIWENDKKETPQHPDFKGSINVEGVDYWVSGWRRGKDDPANRPLATFKIDRKDAAKPAPKSVASPQESDPFEDDIPF
jgi:hypothetical protein